MVEGNYITLTNHFQTLNWLLLELKRTKQKFIELFKQKRKGPEAAIYKYLAGCSEATWQKYEKYFIRADDTATYYTAIILNPTLKMQ